MTFIQRFKLNSGFLGYNCLFIRFHKMLNKIITENENDLIRKLTELIEKVSNDSINEKDCFHVGVSGGSLIKFLTIGLPSAKTDFSKWKIFFCDERIVPLENPDSTYGIYRKDFAAKLGFKDDQFVRIKEGTTASEAANDYIQKISDVFPGASLPRFDMLLLGMGPDGHTCSLFPNHPLLNESNVWIAPIMDSPKPPPARITMTFPVVNNAKFCVFAMAGEGKADMVKRILVDNEDLPAARVQPTNGELFWIIDKAAAKYL